jgi:hypothetical protein
MGRIEVVYTHAVVTGLVGETRWMDSEGYLYESETGGHWTGSGYRQLSEGSTLYKKLSGNATVEVVQRPLTLDPIKPAQPATTYADGNPKAIQGAKKYSLRLLPLPAAIVVNQALEDGVAKYGAANWRETGVAASVYIDACERHIKQWYDGSQELALDSLIHNLGHAMACLAIIVDAQHNGKLIDDRPMPCKDTDSLLLRKVTA